MRKNTILIFVGFLFLLSCAESLAEISSVKESSIINLTAANSIGLNIPVQVLRSASKIIK